MDTERAAEGVISADVDLLVIGLPKIGVLMSGGSSKLEFSDFNDPRLLR
jgi:hypothetical protein